jgi:hypothetical protein
MVFRFCTKLYTADGEVNLDGEKTNVILNQIDKMASSGLRTFGIAYKDVPKINAKASLQNPSVDEFRKAYADEGTNPSFKSGNSGSVLLAQADSQPMPTLEPSQSETHVSLKQHNSHSIQRQKSFLRIGRKGLFYQISFSV